KVLAAIRNLVALQPACNLRDLRMCLPEQGVWLELPSRQPGDVARGLLDGIVGQLPMRHMTGDAVCYTTENQHAALGSAGLERGRLADDRGIHLTDGVQHTGDTLLASDFLFRSQSEHHPATN